VKAVLVVHSAHLMTMPDVVARLAALHGTLTSRLALQNRLLSLSGRLDLVLSQVELRSSSVPATLAPKSKPDSKATTATRYVEGESSDDEQMNAEVESQDEGGSVEEVELGDGSDDEDESDDGEFKAGSDDDEESEPEETEGGDSDDDSSDAGGGLKMNGFVDDEAEEWSGDDEDAEGSDEE